MKLLRGYFLRLKHANAETILLTKCAFSSLALGSVFMWLVMGRELPTRISVWTPFVVASFLMGVLLLMALVLGHSLIRDGYRQLQYRRTAAGQLAVAAQKQEREDAAKERKLTQQKEAERAFISAAEGLFVAYGANPLSATVDASETLAWVQAREGRAKRFRKVK